MKKTIFSIFIILFLVVSCGSAKSQFEADALNDSDLQDDTQDEVQDEVQDSPKIDEMADLIPDDSDEETDDLSDEDMEEIRTLSVTIIPSSSSVIEHGSLNFSSQIEDGIPPYTFTWSFDGVAPENKEESPQDIMFETPGDYTVSLDIEDSTGQTDSTSLVVTVESIEGKMNCYFGNLHSHSAVSDGKGTPEEVMEWAKYGEEIDFYVMTDHAEQIFGNNWALIQEKTDFHTEDGVFVAMRGFEWSHPVNGHMCIYQTDDFTAAYSELWINTIYEWIDERNALAQFNHPGREVGIFNNLSMEPTVVDNMFAIETGNKGTGNNDDEFLPYYYQALDNGWRVAPTSNQDNHSLSLNSHRSVYVGENLSREELLNAMYARRFYSSDDPNIKIFFRSGDNWMGDILNITDNNLGFSIKVEDDEPILSLQLIGNNQAVIAEMIPEEGATSVKWFPKIAVDSTTYVLLKVVSEDILDDDGPEQIAVTAPFWLHR